MLSWLWHPLGQCAGHGAEYIRCRSYNFWSGIGSDIGEVTLICSVLAVGKHLNCSVNHPRFCWRFGHPVHGTGYRACRKHHPHADEGRITPDDLRT